MLKVSIIVVISLLAMSCTKDSTAPYTVVETPIGELELVESYAVDVPEPSGLTFGPGHQTLITVSDHTNMVYELDLQGNIIRMLNYEGKDLEGVAYNPDENVLAIVEEADREITLLDYDSGMKLQTFKIVIPSNADNSGLEGISYNTNNKLYYIVNETNPELMIIWEPGSGIISKDDLGFALDYSGICVETDRSFLWFVSDQSKSIFQCDYNAQVLKRFNLDISKYEGIVVDKQDVYLINDASATLYQYQIKNN
ncbi:MAG: SdiA-regulated domain-containing protein [Bacteroidota bacterium]